MSTPQIPAHKPTPSSQRPDRELRLVPPTPEGEKDVQHPDRELQLAPPSRDAAVSSPEMAGAHSPNREGDATRLNPNDVSDPSSKRPARQLRIIPSPPAPAAPVSAGPTQATNSSASTQPIPTHASEPSSHSDRELRLIQPASEGPVLGSAGPAPVELPSDGPGPSARPPAPTLEAEPLPTSQGEGRWVSVPPAQNETPTDGHIVSGAAARPDAAVPPGSTREGHQKRFVIVPSVPGEPPPDVSSPSPEPTASVPASLREAQAGRLAPVPNKPSSSPSTRPLAPVPGLPRGAAAGRLASVPNELSIDAPCSSSRSMAPIPAAHREAPASRLASVPNEPSINDPCPSSRSTAPVPASPRKVPAGRLEPKESHHHPKSGTSARPSAPHKAGVSTSPDTPPTEPPPPATPGQLALPLLVVATGRRATAPMPLPTQARDNRTAA